MTNKMEYVRLQEQLLFVYFTVQGQLLPLDYHNFMIIMNGVIHILYKWPLHPKPNNSLARTIIILSLSLSPSPRVRTITQGLY